DKDVAMDETGEPITGPSAKDVDTEDTEDADTEKSSTEDGESKAGDEGEAGGTENGQAGEEDEESDKESDKESEKDIYLKEAARILSDLIDLDQERLLAHRQTPCARLHGAR